MKIRASQITTLDLVTEMMKIPYGLKEEVYIRNGFVKFTTPMTNSSWSQDQSNRVQNIEGMSYGEVDGMYEREDGTIEIADFLGEYDVDLPVEKGKYYEKVRVITKEQANEMIESIADEEHWQVSQLAQKINELADKVRDERISYVKAIAEMEASWR